MAGAGELVGRVVRRSPKLEALPPKNAMSSGVRLSVVVEIEP